MHIAHTDTKTTLWWERIETQAINDHSFTFGMGDKFSAKEADSASITKNLKLGLSVLIWRVYSYLFGSSDSETLCYPDSLECEWSPIKLLAEIILGPALTKNIHPCHSLSSHVRCVPFLKEKGKKQQQTPFNPRQDETCLKCWWVPCFVL